MRVCRIVLAGILPVVMLSVAADAKINTVVVHNGDETITRGFKLKFVPAPSSEDAATKATITVVDGDRDQNGGDVEKLNDGKVPTAADEPAENFFFAAGTPGGRLAIDLGQPVAIEQVNTYSWHPSTRGPQVYTLYGGDGTADGFNREPLSEVDPEKAGWKLLARVDTRPTPNEGEAGGQYGVSIFDSDRPLGTYRYLLFDVSRTENEDPFGNTFYSEIDVISSGEPGPVRPDENRRLTLTMSSPDRTYEAVIDTTDSPELSKWANEELAPVVKEWYPKIVSMLPSDGFQAPRSFSITFSPRYRGVAATGGTRVTCAEEWFRRNLDGEAKGAVVHELVHVVQQYGRARRNNPQATRPPGWLVEGIPDYIRWFLYEPQSRGAEISERNLARARYDGSYRISANFLNWVTDRYDREIVVKLNAALRDGKYNEDLWSDYTNRTLAELGDEWKTSHERRLAGEADKEKEKPENEAAGSQSSLNQKINSLSPDERAAGWVLLFDGERLAGWHSFGRDDVRPGWQIKDSALTCADPSDAGDLCTDSQFDWFELRLEYNISEGGNSGIIFRVTDEGRFAWSTGPEFQLEDNAKAADPIRCGWLYGLYQPPIDPKTDKPLDATKPAGEWNQVRLLVSPEKCAHEINGVQYFEYVLGSEDFAKRVAESKFRRMRRFAKADKGYIALQGDHGQISFRNIKIRPIVATKPAEPVSAQLSK